MHALNQGEVMKRIAFALLASLVAAPAWAVSMTVNHYVGATMPAAQCVERGREALRRANLTLLNSTQHAAFGESGEYVVAVYCIAERGTVVITAAGPDTARTEPMVTQVLEALTQVISGGGAK